MRSAIMLVCGVLICASRGLGVAAPQDEFVGDATGQALYEQMMDTILSAQTLSYRSKYRWEYDGKEFGRCTYWMRQKKPNFFRMDTVGEDGEEGGVLIGDGRNQWVYWPNGRQVWVDEDPDEVEAVRYTQYHTRAAMPGRHSIGHQTNLLGVNMANPVVNPSAFHGSPDSMQRNIDGARHLGEETIDGLTCDVILVSVLSGQRTWKLWIAGSDHLPRKLRCVLANDKIIQHDEVWSDIRVNEEIADDLFRWQPPDDWTQWFTPSNSTLPVGTHAPDFTMSLLDGGQASLSDYRGKVVLLNLYRVGCPPCRVEMPHLQRLHERGVDKGLVVLGVNSVDDSDIVRKLLLEIGVTYPNIVDHSQAARDITYSYGGMAVPANYIIDREGQIVASWHGWRTNDPRLKRTLATLGVNIPPSEGDEEN